ncbi:sugar-binding transcriptional regulator [Periweissella fabalis]|uniref:Sugar-binding domain-containing protein n=1 Tax=Periweissella fabalis TaxID=1070421 RepID=A0A7X6S201_9LACO|nr:sugar-binding domain-containing protein [Periweissella fabalis]MCM0599171.1 hypothetical protein [Periweissella fabalis]NKZ23450.1 hypothetical protein [Periweissella fabalis]
MNQEELIVAVAEDYYLNKASFSAISKKYNLSRYLINKYLNDGLKSGLVRIEIKSSSHRNQQLEQVFSDKFPGVHFTIIKDAANEIESMHRLAESSAKVAEQLIHSQQPSVIGLAWGESIYNLIDNFNSIPLEETHFIQFIGENMKYHSTVGSTRMVEKAATKFTCEFQTLPAPLYILNDTTRLALAQEPATAGTLAMGQAMSMLITGLGTLKSVQSITNWNENLAAIIPAAQIPQVVGMIYGRPYDINGQFLNLAHDKTFGLDITTIMQVPTRFCFVRGKFKSLATIGALRGKLITNIVFGESLAYRILADLANI